WLNSGLPNSHDTVGRRLTTHLQDFVTGFFDREVNPDVGQVTMARADFPGYGTLWSQGFGPQSYAAVIAGTGQGFYDDPADDGPADEHGAVPKLVYHPTPESRERENWLARKAVEILRAAGAHTVHRTDIQGFLTHITGTMRMGMHPATSVVNADAEAHEIE